MRAIFKFELIEPTPAQRKNIEDNFRRVFVKCLTASLDELKEEKAAEAQNTQKLIKSS